uniref:C-type lectin domain-containing protein n=1 Tax=Neogobius melanostomus TaxID=47308 RepID=A0A8C6SS81_9GOBI
MLKSTVILVFDKLMVGHIPTVCTTQLNKPRATRHNEKVRTTDLQHKERRLYKLHSFFMLYITFAKNLISEGWQYFKGSWYLGSTTAGSWNESRKFCQEKGADLIIINSIQDFSLTQEFARKFRDGRWIGLSDLEQEGVWRWVDGSLLNTSFWYPGEPNNKGSTEHCAVVNYYNRLENWNDFSCSEKCYCICEK